MSEPTSDHVTLRPARPGDAAAITSAQIRAREPAYRNHLPDGYVDHVSADDRLRRWQERLTDDDSHRVVWVAERDGVIVGVCYASSAYPDPTEDSVHIQSLYIAPDAQGLGLGRRLLEATIASLRAFRPPLATLHVYTTNDRAQRFYEHLGWQRLREVELDTWDGVPIMAIRYGKALREHERGSLEGDGRR